MSTQDNSMEEELDLDGLATTLAALSQGEAPSSFQSTISPFVASEVDWESNSWISRVQSVQEWLYLEITSRPSEGPVHALGQIFMGIGETDTGDCFVQSPGGHLKLTPLGFAQLESRASIAQNRKDSFDQDLADDFGLRQATRRWLSRWEDEPDTVTTESVQVHAEVDNWKIREFKDQAESGRLDLNPSYQRDVVWSNSDSQKLLDSVLRGIPLPSIILNKRKNSRIYEIVDGKQRTTAILRFIGQHPEGIRYARAKSTQEAPFEMFRSNYRKWRRALGISTAEERKHCLPFPLTTYKAGDSLRHLSRRYYDEIKNQTVTIQGSEEGVDELFEQSSKAYLIPVIIYKDTDLHQIHKVFGLYNKQGKQLNAEELRNAIYHHLDLARLLLALGGDSSRPDEIAPFAADLELQEIPEALKELQVGEARFHRTKLVSWVAALLLHPPRRSSSGSIMTPSTSGHINAMLDSVTASSAHPMRDTANLKALASALLDGARLLNELRGEEDAFAGSFTHKKAESARWEDLPTVAAWTACTLACLGGLGPEFAETVSDSVREATRKRPPLDKQQSRSQWGYLTRTIFELLAAMKVDAEQLDGQLKRALGCSCIPSLKAIDSLGIPAQ